MTRAIPRTALEKAEAALDRALAKAETLRVERDQLLTVLAEMEARPWVQQHEALRLALSDLLREIDERINNAAPEVFWEPSSVCHDCTAGTSPQGRPCVLHVAKDALRRIG